MTRLTVLDNPTFHEFEMEILRWRLAGKNKVEFESPHGEKLESLEFSDDGDKVIIRLLRSSD